jgi:hypothetical protein
MRIGGGEMADTEHKDMITIRDFVADTLTGIVKAVKQANADEDCGFEISGARGDETTYVDFDIAVAVTKAKSGGLEIGVATVGAGLFGKIGLASSRKDERLSRVRFKIHNHKQIF